MTSDESKPIFHAISSIEDIAALLNTSKSQLNYILHVRPANERYTKFTIAKRRGGTREINAPKFEIKVIQRKLSDFLQDRISFRTPVHGFVRDRNIATNAEMHVRHRVVLNIDLKNFFPTINFGRVRGLFMTKPFAATPHIATILAQICCHEGVLPQGAPTSPVVSNLICSRMDAQLLRLAKRHGCIYSRYADDLTFSKRKGGFPHELAKKDDSGTVIIGGELNDIIEKNGFHIHPDKKHLYTNTHRQSVTGLTVNSHVNVSREYIREIRAIICDWRKNGLTSAEEKHHSQYYRRPSLLGEKPSLSKILEGKLNFIKMIRGADDQVRRNLQHQLVSVWPDYLSIMEKENRELKMRDLFISHASEDKADFVRPLVDALIGQGVSVWYDEFELTIGDDLVAKINAGLTTSRYGVVVLSPNFFGLKKTWPDREVGALFAQEDADKRPRVLPIWHNVDLQDVVKRNPILAGKFAWKSSDFAIDNLAINFREFMKTRRK